MQKEWEISNEKNNEYTVGCLFDFFKNFDIIWIEEALQEDDCRLQNFNYSLKSLRAQQNLLSDYFLPFNAA